MNEQNNSVNNDSCDDVGNTRNEKIADTKKECVSDSKGNIACNFEVDEDNNQQQQEENKQEENKQEENQDIVQDISHDNMLKPREKRKIILPVAVGLAVLIIAIVVVAAIIVNASSPKSGNNTSATVSTNDGAFPTQSGNQTQDEDKYAKATSPEQAAKRLIISLNEMEDPQMLSSVLSPLERIKLFDSFADDDLVPDYNNEKEFQQILKNYFSYTKLIMSEDDFTCQNRTEWLASIEINEIRYLYTQTISKEAIDKYKKSFSLDQQGEDISEFALVKYKLEYTENKVQKQETKEIECVKIGDAWFALMFNNSTDIFIR